MEPTSLCQIRIQNFLLNAVGEIEFHHIAFHSDLADSLLVSRSDEILVCNKRFFRESCIYVKDDPEYPEELFCFLFYENLKTDVKCLKDSQFAPFLPSDLGEGNIA